MSSILKKVFACCLLTVVAGGIHAQPRYPEKPIRLIVPFSPGGGGDVQGRLVAAKLAERLKQPVIVDNRAGAGGNIGTAAVARAAPDGYTLLLATAATVINPHVWAKAGFEARDLTGVAAWSLSPLLILAHPAVPVTGLRELVAHAKAKPGELTFASGGIGIITHVQMELFKQRAGIDILHVPFPGQAPAVTAVAGGHVLLLADSVASGMPQVKAGRLRALAITSKQRAAAAPEIPTMAEQGYGDVANSAWYGVMAPANTPREVLKMLSDAMTEALAEPETRRQLAAVGAEPFVLEVDAFNRFLAQQGKTWSELVERAKIRVE